MGGGGGDRQETETCQITFADFIGRDELWIDWQVTVGALSDFREERRSLTRDAGRISRGQREKEAERAAGTFL